jgi:hypothetical protein
MWKLYTKLASLTQGLTRYNIVMRIWDIPASQLCRKHLLGEHRELHAIWAILTTDKKGYRKHPETKRWEGKFAALYKRHQEQVTEMEKRNYKHHSPLDQQLATGKATQDEMVHSVAEQRVLLKNKNCDCLR